MQLSNSIKFCKVVKYSDPLHLGTWSPGRSRAPGFWHPRFGASIRNDSTSPPRLEMWQWALHPPPVICNRTWTRLEHSWRQGKCAKYAKAHDQWVAKANQISQSLRKISGSPKMSQMRPCSLPLVTIQDEVHPSHHWGLLGKVLEGSWNVAKMWHLFTCPKWSMHLNKDYLKGCISTSPMNHDGSK